jgi:hypothetical protein
MQTKSGQVQAYYSRKRHEEIKMILYPVMPISNPVNEPSSNANCMILKIKILK